MCVYLQEFVSHGDDGEYETGECCGEAHELQHKGSPCTSGGLHMPNSHSLHAFATRVQRLRYYSQCGPVHDYSGTYKLFRESLNTTSLILTCICE